MGKRSNDGGRGGLALSAPRTTAQWVVLLLAARRDPTDTRVEALARTLEANRDGFEWNLGHVTLSELWSSLLAETPAPTGSVLESFLAWATGIVMPGAESSPSTDAL